MSLVSGPTSKPLRTITLGALAETQSEIYNDRTALIVPWQNKRFTFRELFSRANTICKALIELGLQYGDCVGIFAGNCSEYLEVFLGAAFIGCPVVVLNSNYTPSELESTVRFSGRSKVPHLHTILTLKTSTRMQVALRCKISWARKRHDASS
jgi:acyl-CoA synthetase (AMP-forming)/AMP-acid ligase II